jgi:WD40 repeat protein/tetratricopeptide (TPR) repeat protein
MTRTLFTLAATLLLLAGARAVAAPPEFQPLLDRASKETAAGRHREADTALEEAIQSARKAKDKQLEARAVFASALNQRSWIAAGNRDPRVRARLMKAYEHVVKEGKGTEREMACNNLGVLYLRSGKVDDALRVFATAGEPTTTAHTFYYNYGRVLEKAKKPEEALKKYWLSIRKQPRYLRAASTAARLLAQNLEFPSRVDEARRLLEFYDGDEPGGPQDLLGPLLYDLLPQWGDEAGVRRLLPFLLSDLARSRVDQERFKQLYSTDSDSKEARTGELGRLKKTPVLGRALAELATIYQGDLVPRAESPLLSKRDVLAALPLWAEVLRLDQKKTEKALATVLMLAGDSFYRQSLAKEAKTADALQALKRFTAAFALTPTAVEPALSAVRILVEKAPVLDPRGALLNRYAERLYHAKTGLLLRAHTRDDHARLQTLHIILATIFERQGKWGPSSRPQTATFQWQAAITDEQNLRRLDPAYPVSPDLRSRLGEAYVQAKSELAAGIFLEAADLSLTLGKPDTALKVLQRVRDLTTAHMLLLNEQQSPQARSLEELATRSVEAKLKYQLVQPDLVRAAVLSDRADWLILGGRKRIVAYDLGDGGPTLVRPTAGHPWQGHGLAWLPGESAKLIRGQQHTIELWDAREFSKPEIPLGRHENIVRAVASCARGHVLASLDFGGQVKIWSVAKKEEMRTIKPPRAEASHIALSPDGKHLALGGQKTVTVWDVASGERQKPMESPGVVTSLGISPDGRILAIGTAAGQVEIRDLSKGEKLHVLKGHSGAVRQLQFSSRGPLLATVDSVTVRLWDASKFDELARFGSPLPPLSVCFSADGKTLAVGYGRSTGRGLARVWDLARLLPEGRSESGSADFYHLAEGSEIFPTDWLVALKSSRTGKPFVEDLGRFGFIADSNGPQIHGAPGKRLPIGMTVVKPRGLSLEMVGVNCAACHVTQITYRGKAQVIAGAPGLLDVEAFYQEIFQAVEQTLGDPRELIAFLERLQKNGPRDGPTKILVALLPRLKGGPGGGLEDVILNRLKTLSGEKPPTLGVKEYLRLAASAGGKDAQEMARKLLEQQLQQRTEAAEQARALLKAITSGAKEVKGDLGKLLAQIGPEKLALLEARLVFLHRLKNLHAPGRALTRPGPGRVDAFVTARNLLFPSADSIPATSPVRFPHLWGLKKLAWLHWDGNTNSIMERNIGQALGLGAIAVAETGQSTVLPVNLHKLEGLAKKIQPPVWPGNGLGFPAIDAGRANKGGMLYETHCASCHVHQRGATLVPGGGPVYPVEKVGTDPLRAQNFAAPMSNGQSFASQLGAILTKIKTLAFKDAGLTEKQSQDMDLPQNKIRWLTTRGYVARPLAGIWATAPYLHNGSVPTLDDLLRPAPQRPRIFPVGHREYDPVKIGYVSDPAGVPRDQLDRVVYFDVRQPGNSNAGHEYGTALGAEERRALLEYLKTLK